ncbi:hypothetical protein VTH06DRAFT_1691 [Thermothelomyces fergusii]
MVRLREIPRTAAFAWSPDPSPILVTGTRSGAVDADFSDETKLELWDLNLDAADQGLELQPVASISTESRFYDIAWGAPSDEHPRGVIAGAMEDGSLQLWDAAKLLAGEEALMSRDTKHTGPIKALQFNPVRPQVLATAGVKGELFIWDVNDTSTAFRLGTAAAHDIDCVAWNRRVSNILATGSAGGFVTVWDLKTKKASLTLNNNRKPVSAIAWDPNNSTNLLTATSDDNSPVVLLWNLRNSQAPEKTLQGHDQGILSLSWCQQDPGLLLSCGKDNRTLVWNPQTGERYGEFPEATNWTFLTRFNPGNPNLVATASFDGKITIQTLQNTNPSAVPTAQASMSDDDFFSKAPTQLQGASFSLPRAPVWFERPVGVSFGYGGKVVTFRKNDTPAGQPRSSKIQISSFSVDSDIGLATEKFEEAYKNGDIAAICDSHVADAKTEEEKADWQVLKALSESDGRTKIIEYLGFAKDDEPPAAAAEPEAAEATKEEAKEETGLAPPQTNGEDEKKTHKRVTSMWGDVDDGDDFLSDLTAAKGAKTDNPFQLLGEGNSAEDQITRAIILGKFEKAVDLCLKEDRVADAFILANCGGKELVDKVQKSYLAQKKGSSSYLRLISSVIGKNLWDVVYNADLSNWKETMVTLCTFADPSDFPDLCEALGDRILEAGPRKDASFCYLVGSKLEKVVDIWIAELEEAEQAGLREASNDSTFSIHARSLQHFIEKVTIFRHVTKFTDTEKELSEGWKLAALYDKYTQYADIVAGHGQLSVAQRYLDLLPADYPAAEVARNRVKLATQTSAPQPAQRQGAAPAPRVSSRGPTPVGYRQPASIPAAAAASNPNPYAPAPAAAVQPAPAASSNPYAPPTATSQYTPSGASPSVDSPPPRNPGPPPKINRDVGNWNDVPMVTKPPVRRTTPSVPPITSPFPGQPSPAGPYQRIGHTPPPPPPKGSAPPRNVPDTPRWHLLRRTLTAPPPTFQAVPPPPPQQQSAVPPPPPPQGSRPPVGPPPRAGPPPAAGGPPPAAQAATSQSPASPKTPATQQSNRHPPGDRSHIPANAQRMVELLCQEMQRVASKAPAAFAPQVKDTQKRLNLLFDHLNNQELVRPDTIEQLTTIAEAITGKNYELASKLQTEIHRDKMDECGQWMAGLKRLISMSKATP